jgi:hypothetical protein
MILIELCFVKKVSTQANESLSKNKVLMNQVFEKDLKNKLKEIMDGFDEVSKKLSNLNSICKPNNEEDDFIEEIEQIVDKLKVFVATAPMKYFEEIYNEVDMKSKKIIEQENEIQTLQSKIKQSNDEVQASEMNINDMLAKDEKKKKKISELMDELSLKNSKIIEQQNCIQILETALREQSNIAELEQLLTVVKSKNDRIQELEQTISSSESGTHEKDSKDDRILILEEALRQSVLIATERERVFDREEQERLGMLEKVRKVMIYQSIY